MRHDPHLAPRNISKLGSGRALRKVTQLKNKARQAVRKAKRQGENSTATQPLAANFLSLLRDYSHLKRESSRRLCHKEATVAREGDFFLDEV